MLNANLFVLRNTWKVKGEERIFGITYFDSNSYWTILIRGNVSKKVNKAQRLQVLLINRLFEKFRFFCFAFNKLLSNCFLACDSYLESSTYTAYDSEKIRTSGRQLRQHKDSKFDIKYKTKTFWRLTNRYFLDKELTHYGYPAA
jgi:hypothetical protein